MSYEDMSKTFRSSRCLWLAGLFAFILCPGLVYLTFPSNPSSFPQFGENDFVEYWAANQLHRRGGDPYNPVLVYAVERAQGWSEQKPLMMWNPPWTLSILGPILAFDFETSSRLFLGLNIGLLFFSAALVLDARGSRLGVWPIGLLFAVCSFPAYLALLLGQLSIVLTAAVSGLYWSLKKEKYHRAGFCLALLTVKPHVLFLLGLVLVDWAIRGGWKKVLPSFCLSLAAFLAVLLFQSPPTLTAWMNRGQYSENPMLVQVLNWRTTSLASLLRDTVKQISGTFTPNLLFLVPSIAAAALIFVLIKKRPAPNWDFVFPAIIPLSCSTAAFSWIFDGTVCLITQVALATTLLEKERNPTKRLLPILAMLALQFAMLVHSQLKFSGYQEFWYFSPALFAVWFLSQRRIF